MSFSARGVASTPILILIEGCCGLGVRARGAFGFSNEKSFTYCISTPICGTGVCEAPGCGAGPPFVVDIVISGWRAWLTCGRAANNAGQTAAGLGSQPKKREESGAIEHPEMGYGRRIGLLGPRRRSFNVCASPR